MSIRDTGSYIGYNRVTSTSQDSASGIWSLRAVERQMRAAAWPQTFPFAPDDLSGLQLWLDASDASTLYDATTGGSLVAADGGVARWEDKSGNNRHATQGTSADQPLRKTAIQNGLDVLRFDGSNNYMDSTDFLDMTAGQSLTIIAAVKRATTGGNHAIVSKYGKSNAADGNTADGWAFRFLSTDKMDFFGRTDEAGGSSVRLTDSTITASAFTVLSVKASAGSLSAATMYRNASVVASSATITSAETLENTTYAVTVGALRYTFNEPLTQYLQFFNGDIAEILIYDSALSDTDREAVENYLLAKWGIA